MEAYRGTGEGFDLRKKGEKRKKKRAVKQSIEWIGLLLIVRNGYNSLLMFKHKRVS